MYKNKPLIIAKRPWWRNPMFPWGWYSLVQDGIPTDKAPIFPDGYYEPKDGGGGGWCWIPGKTSRITRQDLLSRLLSGGKGKSPSM